ncbi:hypothetical protein PVT68_11680 [Microbulbifer bruguierae]|uniref:Uncharacterized protein n=1 Tax=Microbulbifer bruguierae TaxID=3029061 RepID=A0ABY8N959_9GAMM|nr:hypothetical protein [Microbulbifer bruguierae]WGL15428.1 hypothetical protein PVT68_11680 [Microbulbifer bruguierae]
MYFSMNRISGFLEFRRLNSVLFCVLLTLCSMDSRADSAPIQSRQLQIIQVGDLFRLGVDTDPPWQWDVLTGNNSPVFTAESPSNYYPSTVVEFSYYPQWVLKNDLQAIRTAAMEAVSASSKKFGIVLDVSQIDLQPFEFERFSGFRANFTASYNSSLRDVELYIGRSLSGHPVSMTVITLPGKLPHLVHLISRVGNSFSPIQSMH